MTFFPEPLRPSKEPEKDNIRVSPIEADKKGREPPLWEFPANKRKIYYGAIIITLAQCATLFSRMQEMQDREDSNDTLISDIHLLRTLLGELMEMNQSQNAHFAQSLSYAWHALLQQMYPLSGLNKMSKKIDLSKLKAVLQSMDDYPPNEDRTLGFYLTELHGKNWLPAPFMDILRQLHHEHQVNRGVSHLQKWSILLEESQDVEQ